MRLKESVEDGFDVFALEGEIDLNYAPCLRSLLQSKISARAPALILDLSKVEYIDSTGMATMIEYFRDASKHRGVLCLTGLNPNLKTIFEMVRLDKTIPTFASVADAIAALKQGAVQPPEEALFNRHVA
jgi:anti-sigma B factor antagonist